MTRVKICGLTREDDVALAVALGAAWVGFNFAAESPRRVDARRAEKLSRAAGAGVLRVGVFVDEPASAVREAVEAARLDLVQLHRPLRPEDLDGAPVPIVAVAHVASSGPALPPDELLARCAAVLFDTRAPEAAGGTGVAFDWRAAAGRTLPAPVLLAGGLTPENVGLAIRAAHPYGVDVASGVESSPGIKDPKKMRRFVEAVTRADGDAA